MSKDWRIGCSGFYNKHWKGIFYPDGLPQSKFFDYYSGKFNSLELNVTFYRFPKAETLKKWYDKSTDGFDFAVKAPKLITHMKKLNDCDRLLDDFYSACEEGLKEKLGCTLFQFPPSFKYSEDRLEQVIKSLRPEFKNVIEFRDEGWWNKKVYEVLAENNIIFCSVNHPKLPEDLIINSDTAYIRLHGNPDIFYSKYSGDELHKLYLSINKKRKVKTIYVYFNNTASNAGIENAIEMKRLALKI
jgi:uncharacterized protein YecE (DUF72 family)